MIEMSFIVVEKTPKCISLQINILQTFTDMYIVPVQRQHLKA